MTYLIGGTQIYLKPVEQTLYSAIVPIKKEFCFMMYLIGRKGGWKELSGGEDLKKKGGGGRVEPQERL